MLSAKLELLTPETLEHLLNDCTEINKMLNALIKSLSTRHSPLATLHSPLSTLPSPLSPLHYALSTRSLESKQR